MNKDIIKTLIEAEELIDVASLGFATQSSLSKWSKENDAQRAVLNKEYKDFAFHTEKEKNPWWQIEFKMPVAVEYIVINNRKRSPFDEIASNITVSVYDEDNDEILLHSGTTYFGSELEGCPMIIPLQSKISIQRLKITLLKENYLHLSNINVLLNDPLRSFGGKPIFIANRGDGLGERLRALLNSMLLAKNFGGYFIFAWPLSFSQDQFHAIEKPEDIFSSDFIKSHLVTRNMLSRCEIKDLRAKKDFIALNNDSYKKIGINVDQAYLNDQIKDKNLQLKNISSEYKLAFKKINFNKEVTEAINLARSLQLKDKVLGIHLRTGDLVYGEYRYLDRYYSKVVPFYAVEALVKRYLNMGYDIVLFSQDNEACQYFRDKYGVVLSHDLIPYEYNDVQLAIFDIVLMSRCKHIVSGTSGFAILASWIGGGDILNYKEILSEKEIKSSFMKSLEDGGVLTFSLTPPLLASFSIAHYLQSFKQSNSILERVSLINKCLKIDPPNDFYRLLLALDYYKKNDFETADNILLEIIKVKDMGNIKWLLENKPPKVRFLSEYIIEFRKYATQGSMLAAYVVFLMNRSTESIKVDDLRFYSKFADMSSKEKLSKARPERYEEFKALCYDISK